MAASSGGLARVRSWEGPSRAGAGRRRLRRLVHLTGPRLSTGKTRHRLRKLSPRTVVVLCGHLLSLPSCE